jgi:hypothetical protein
LNASVWALAVAIAGMDKRPRLALVDGNKTPHVD